MIGIKKIDVEYTRLRNGQDCPRFVMEWGNEEGMIITNVIPKNRTFKINWEANGHLKETDYFRDGSCNTVTDSGCDGLRIPLPGTNDYGDHTITIEFSDGTVIPYDLPEQGEVMLHDLMDYVESRHAAAPGHSEMATAARLLDDDMMYEI